MNKEYKNKRNIQRIGFLMQDAASTIYFME